MDAQQWRSVAGEGDEQFAAGEDRWTSRERDDTTKSSENGGGGDHGAKDGDDSSSSEEDGDDRGGEEDEVSHDGNHIDAKQTGDQRGRQRAGGRRTGGRRRRIHFEISELQQLYHLPLKTAAERLGICEAALKRICRRNHIRKWPYRQLQSIHRRMTHLEDEENNSQSTANANSSAGVLGVDGATTPSKTSGEQQRSPARSAKIGSKLPKDKKLDLLEEERQRVIDLAHRAKKTDRSNEDPTQQRGFETRSFLLDAPLTFGELLMGSIPPYTPLEAGNIYDANALSCSVQDESALLLLATVCCNETTIRELHTRHLAALRG